MFEHSTINKIQLCGTWHDRYHTGV